MSTSRKRIYRSEDRIVSGVFGGFAEYFGVEPTIFRLAMVFLIFATGIIPGLLTYFVAVLIMPNGPEELPDHPEDGSVRGETETASAEEPAPPAESGS